MISLLVSVSACLAPVPEAAAFPEWLFGFQTEVTALRKTATSQQSNWLFGSVLTFPPLKQDAVPTAKKEDVAVAAASTRTLVLNGENFTIGNLNARDVFVNEEKKPGAIGKTIATKAAASSGKVLPKADTKPKANPADPVCSLESSNLELHFILKALSEQTKVNLILLGAGDKKLTVRLNNVRLSEMLRHICALSDLESLKVAGTYVIAPEEVLKEKYPKDWEAVHPTPAKAPEPEPVAPAVMVTRTYHTNYADPESLSTSLKTMFPGISIVPGPTLVSPTVSKRETKEATGISQGVLEKGDQVVGSRRVLLIRGAAEDVQNAIDAAKQLDTERPQVSIKVEIHDISRDAMKELGLSWNYGNLNFNEQDPRGINFGSFTRAPLNFGATIKALETKDFAKLMAAPSISVLDGESAFILIGSRLNFPVLTGYSSAGNPIFDKQEERVGIYLQVATSVADDGQITLSLYPQVSTVTGFLDVNGASYPQIATREAQTTLRVMNGETIVLGGMIRDEEIRELEKVPLLSQIPIFGELFTRRKRQKKSSEVIISLTPVIIGSAKK